MEEAIREENLGVTECTRIDAKWSFGEESVDVLDELIALTATAVAARKAAPLTALPSHPTPATQHPQRMIKLNGASDSGKGNRRNPAAEGHKRKPPRIHRDDIPANRWHHRRVRQKRGGEGPTTDGL